MTTTEHHNEIIDRARQRYLAAHPPRIKSVPAVDLASGQPAGEPFLIPDLGDMQIIGCKLGMEYLAICHDDEAVEEWIHTAMGIVKSPELAAILFANVFRGVNSVIGNMVEDAGARTRMQQLAVEAWTRDFSAPFPDEGQDLDGDDLGNEPW